MLTLCLRYTKQSPASWRICLLEVSGCLSHLSSMKFLRRDPTFHTDPELRGYSWSRLRFSFESFSPCFWPLATACLWGGSHPHRAVHGSRLEEGPSTPGMVGGICRKQPWEGRKGCPLCRAQRSVCKRQAASEQADGHISGQILTGCRPVNCRQTYTLQGHGCVLPHKLSGKS